MRHFLAGLGLEQFAELAGALASAMRIVLVVAVGWLILHVLERLLQKMRGRMPWRNRDADSEQRAETLVRVIRYVASAAVVVVAALLVLGELGVAVTPLLATAGVAGVAIGFGAQTLVKDCLNGFFLLLEDQVRQGDVVEIGGKDGLVEEVTLRYVRLRDYEGAVHFIPAGSIATVTNRSRGYAYAVTDLHLSYRVDTDCVFALMRDVARTMREDVLYGPRILEDIEIAGVDALGDAGITVKCRLKVRSLEQWAVRREFLRRLKTRFAAENIDLPMPRLALYRGGRAGASRRRPATAQSQDEPETLR